MIPRSGRAILLTILLLGATFGATAQIASENASGRRVEFPLVQFGDTLFTAVEGAFRIEMDDDGHVWYSSEGGLVHVDPTNRSREIFTKFEGLPSSYTLGLTIRGDTVYVGTDFGIGIVDRKTGEVRAMTQANSLLPDAVAQDVMLIGDDLWIGTRYYGVAVWNTTKDWNDASAWTFKNTSTSPSFAAPVRRIQPTPTAIWVSTEGDGAWRYDRAAKNWTVLLPEDGLPDRIVLSVAQRGNEILFGTNKGLAVLSANVTKIYNHTHGMPDDRVLDVDVMITSAGTADIYASTRKGVWQFDPTTGKAITRGQNYGILGSYVFDLEPTPHGVLYASSRGVSHYHPNGTWSYYATGPTSGPSTGPLSFGYTSASVGDGGNHLWFGTARGLSAYRLPTGGQQGYWQNFGEWQNYPAPTSNVNWIDTHGNVTWFATNQGAYGFEHDTGRWISKTATNSRNLVYGLEADRGELWVALFGDGLLMTNLTTGVSRSWDLNSPLTPIPDQLLTDVRAQGDTIWLGASVGIIRMDRVSGSVRATYSTSEGLPEKGYVFRVVPDGPVVWAGLREGGVAKLDVATGKVSRVWNASNTPGFPEGEVRALHREGPRLWVGFKEGLARIDVTTGDVRSWNQTSTDLVQNFVNGITSADGLLYLATLSGIQRMDIAGEKLLPMWDGPGIVRAENDGSGLAPTRVSVRIHTPRDGSGVTGETLIEGSAFMLGRPIDRVEVRVGAGEWQPANGTERWSFAWNSSAHPANTPIRLAARAHAGNASGETEIAVTPVAAPDTPLRIEEVPPGDAYANRPLQMAARAEGDEPLTVDLFYSPAGADGFAKLRLTRQGGLFLGTIPAAQMKLGEMRYYFEAQSGLLIETAAGSASAPATLVVEPTPSLAVALEGPQRLTVKAGSDVAFTLNVTNVGTLPATFTLAAAGLRASWISVPIEDIALEPGEMRPIEARMSVPAAAFSDNTTVTFQVRDRSGLADPATTSVPVQIQGTERTNATPTPATKPDRVIPFPPVVALAAVAVALALAARRSRL